MLSQEQKEYKSKQSLDQTIQKLMQKVDDLESKVPDHIYGDSAKTTANQNTQGTIMGGKNDQIRKKGKIGPGIERRSNDQGTMSSVSAVVSERRIGSLKASVVQELEPGTIEMNECDTKADTSCLGTTWRVLEYIIQMADVYSYDHLQKPIKGVWIVSGVTLWDDPATGEPLLLVIHEGLYIARNWTIH